jgi:hypothetical protein
MKQCFSAFLTQACNRNRSNLRKRRSQTQKWHSFGLGEHPAASEYLRHESVRQFDLAQLTHLSGAAHCGI